MIRPSFFIAMYCLAMTWTLVACAIFARGLQKKNFFWVRIICAGTLSIALSAAMGIALYHFLLLHQQAGGKSETIYPLLNVVGYIAMLGLSIVSLLVCFSEKRMTLLFVVTAGYCTLDIAMSVNNIFSTIFKYASFSCVLKSSPLEIATYISFYIGTYWLIYRLFARNLDSVSEVVEMNSGTTIILFISILIVCIALRSYGSFYSSVHPTMFVLLSIAIICCCLIILYVEFLLSKKLYDEREKDILLQLEQQRLQQYEFTRETIDIINIKCHDLKHQLMALKSNEGIDRKYLEELQKSISFYSSMASTNNVPLDTVLTDKSLFCTKNGIRLTYMIQGEDISFLSAADIYSLFGNALDNAIEYVLTLSEEKRIIKLFAGRREGFTRITVQNYYEGEPVLTSAAIPKTTKADPYQHGFGIKSIRQIAKKYGGSVSILTDNNLFTLSVLIPITM